LKAAQHSQGQSYSEYIDSLRCVSSIKEVQDFPKLTIVYGASPYLRQRAMVSLAQNWATLTGIPSQNFETSDFDEAAFRSLWSQVSLFEPVNLYILKRAGNVKQLSQWLKAIASPSSLKSYLLLDLGDKVSADLQKHAARLSAHMVPCFEPESYAGIHKVAVALTRRFGVSLDDAAVKLILDAVGLDLCKIENEIINLSLRFHGQNRQLTVQDVSGLIGAVREDDVFELFNVLRGKNASMAALLIDAFVGRGESPIALNGILARYSREQVERGSLRHGLAGLKACARVDRKIKSTGMDDSLLLAAAVDSLTTGVTHL
jgi:DNA polymerase III delta subunit